MDELRHRRTGLRMCTCPTNDRRRGVDCRSRCLAPLQQKAMAIFLQMPKMRSMLRRLFSVTTQYDTGCWLRLQSTTRTKSRVPFLKISDKELVCRTTLFSLTRRRVPPRGPKPYAGPEIRPQLRLMHPVRPHADEKQARVFLLWPHFAPPPCRWSFAVHHRRPE